MTAELTRVKAQLAQVTSEKLEWSMKLGAASAESDKVLNELSVMCSARDRVEGSGRSSVGKST